MSHLNEEYLRYLENYIMSNPEKGDIIQGTGGLRKIRWSLPETGKSSGMRILYIDLLYYGKIYMIDLFTKNEKSNLSKAEKNSVKQVIQLLEKELN